MRATVSPGIAEEGSVSPRLADLGADTGFDAVEGSLEVARLYLWADKRAGAFSKAHASLHRQQASSKYEGMSMCKYALQLIYQPQIIHSF